MTISLYPDQIAIKHETGEAFKDADSVLMQAPTGIGKTITANSIVQGAVAKGRKVYFTVPRRDLLRQTSLTMSKFDIRHSFIAAGYEYNPFSQVFVCSTDTLKLRLDKLLPPSMPEFLVVDETHWGNEGLDKIIKFFKARKAKILGLSATPWKSSGHGLGCWYDRMVCGPSIRWLIDNKRLSDYRLFAPDTPDLSGIRTVAGEYNRGQLSEKMEQDRVLIGNSVSHYKKHAEGKLNIVFCVSIKHSEIVAQAFRDKGIVAMHVDGETPDDERRKIIRDFALRKIQVLTSCEIFCFGFDLASNAGMDVTIESISDLRPTKSLALQLQKNGRALRYKNYPALIMDHAGNTMRHDLPCIERKWTLEDREKKKGGEKTLPVRQCPAPCFFCHSPAPVCPQCGFVYPILSREIDEVEGELKEITEAQTKTDRKARAMREYQCVTLHDWQELGRQMGHKPGWAFHRFSNMKPRHKEAAE